VDFELSDDQVALRDAAAALLEGRCPSTRVREVAGSERHLDAELWEAMAAQGWPAVERPAHDGGLGLGMVEVAVLCEQLGRHLAPVPFVGTVLAHGALTAAAAPGGDAGDAADGAEAGDTTGVAAGGVSGLGDVDMAGWARRLAAGDARGALAWSSRDDAVLAERRAGTGWRLTGRTDPVVFGPDAEVVVVFARASGVPAVFALAQPDSARPAPQPAMDRTRSLARLELDDAPATRLGGPVAADALLDRAATAVSAEMLGAASRVLEMTVQYAKDRVQFGRPIGGFQAVKHRCADMLVDVEGMRSAAYYAAWAVGAGDPEASSAAAAAKVWCSDAARRVMASGLQVHGGIGFTWEHDLHLFLKRSQLDQVSFGTAAHHRERLARILRPRAEAGEPVL